MNEIARNILQNMRIEYPPGTRVELINMTDPNAPEEGTRGTVCDVDDIGSILVHWDDGTELNLLMDVDQFKKIDE